MTTKSAVQNFLKYILERDNKAYNSKNSIQRVHHARQAVTQREKTGQQRQENNMTRINHNVYQL